LRVGLRRSWWGLRWCGDGGNERVEARSGVVAFTEDGGAYADGGGTFFDGDSEVVRHAHGELREGRVGGQVFVAQAAEVLEIGAGEGGVVGEGWDGHEAADFNIGEGGEAVKQGRKFIRSKAVLRGFRGEFDFDEDGEGFVKGVRGFAEAGGRFEGIDGVDGGKEFGGLGGLVALKRADEVKQGIGGGGLRREAKRGKVSGFGGELLDAVFAKEPLASCVGLKDGFSGVGLADGHQGDGSGVAVGVGAGCGDLVAQVVKVRGNGHGSVPVYGVGFEVESKGFMLERRILVGRIWSCIQLGSFTVLKSRFGPLRHSRQTQRSSVQQQQLRTARVSAFERYPAAFDVDEVLITF
jgi:hypothetical protein